jgi:dihydropyrimidinase
MGTTLVKNGTVVTASDRYQADIYIDKGVVTLIGQGLNLPADTVIDASGMLVMPGGIDVHTHLDMPFGGTTSADDFETGTIAAAHGGTDHPRRLRHPELRRGPLPRRSRAG